MTNLSRQQILAAAPQLYPIEVPEWGGTVYLRPITLAEQGKLADLGTKYEKAGLLEKLRRITMQVIVWVTCDSAGAPLFTVDDIDVLMERSAGSINRLQDEISKISGLTPESRAELEKNLPRVAIDGPDLS